MDVGREEMKVAGAREEEAVDGIRWRQMVCCGDPERKRCSRKRPVVFIMR